MKIGLQATVSAKHYCFSAFVTIFDIEAGIVSEGESKMISGVNGSNCILESMARIRVERKMIDRAEIVGNKGEYVVEFYGSCAEWNGEPAVLCSARDPYRPRHFKSLDGAASNLSRIGLDKLKIVAS